MQFYFLTQLVNRETIYSGKRTRGITMKTQILSFKSRIKTGTYLFINNTTELNTIKDKMSISGSNINNNHYENVIFSDCTFQSSDICNCKFINCLFLNCKFNFCKLENCNFISCTIEDTLFYLTNSLNCNFLSCTFNNIESIESYNNNGYIHNCKDLDNKNSNFAIAA